MTHQETTQKTPAAHSNDVDNTVRIGGGMTEIGTLETSLEGQRLSYLSPAAAGELSQKWAEIGRSTTSETRHRTIFERHTPVGAGIAISPKANKAAVVRKGRLVIHDLAAGLEQGAAIASQVDIEIAGMVQQYHPLYQEVALSKDGSFAVVGMMKNGERAIDIAVFDTTEFDAKLITKIDRDLCGWPHHGSIDVSPAGNKILVSAYNGSSGGGDSLLYDFSEGSLQLLGERTRYSKPRSSGGFSPDGSMFFLEDKFRYTDARNPFSQLAAATHYVDGRRDYVGGGITVPVGLSGGSWASDVPIFAAHARNVVHVMDVGKRSFQWAPALVQDIVSRPKRIAEIGVGTRHPKCSLNGDASLLAVANGLRVLVFDLKSQDENGPRIAADIQHNTFTVDVGFADTAGERLIVIDKFNCVTEIW